MLADFATVQDGKVTMVGAGWNSTIGSGPAMMAVAGVFHVDWDAANQPFEFRMELVDGDGQPVRTATPIGEQPIVVQGRLEAGRPLGLPRGTTLAVPVALTFMRPPLAAGAYAITVFVANEAAAHLAFNAMPSPQQQGSPPS